METLKELSDVLDLLFKKKKRIENELNTIEKSIKFTSSRIKEEEVKIL